MHACSAMILMESWSHGGKALKTEVLEWKNTGALGMRGEVVLHASNQLECMGLHLRIDELLAEFMGQV